MGKWIYLPKHPLPYPASDDQRLHGGNALYLHFRVDVTLPQLKLFGGQTLYRLSNARVGVLPFHHTGAV